MNKTEFIKQLSARAGQSQQQTGKAVDAALGLVSEVLNSGEELSIPDFGKFSLHMQKERQGRNPRTGEPITIPEHRVVRFKPFLGIYTYAHKHQ